MADVLLCATGKTYENKVALKECGFVYDSEKGWHLSFASASDINMSSIEGIIDTLMEKGLINKNNPKRTQIEIDLIPAFISEFFTVKDRRRIRDEIEEKADQIQEYQER